MDKKLFDQVQNVLKRRSRKPRNSIDVPVTLFDGLLICNVCGTKYTRHITRKYKNAYIMYNCRRGTGASHYNNRCSNKTSTSESRIETYLLTIFQKELDKHILTIQDIKEAPVVVDTSAIKSRISSLNKKLDKIKDLYLDDLIDKDVYASDYKRILSEIDILTKELHQDNPKMIDKTHIKRLQDMASKR